MVVRVVGATVELAIVIAVAAVVLVVTAVVGRVLGSNDPAKDSSLVRLVLEAKEKDDEELVEEVVVLFIMKRTGALCVAIR